MKSSPRNGPCPSGSGRVLAVATKPAAGSRRCGVAALDADDLVAHLTRDVVAPLADAAAVRPDVLDEQVGVVHEAGGQAPGGPAVVPGQHDRAADEGRPAHLLARRAQADEVPVR